MKKSFCYTVLLQFIMSYMLPVVVPAQASNATQPIKLDYLAPQTYLIEDIQVVGNQTLDREAIIALVGIKVGDAVDLPGTTITEAIHRLWKQRLIRDVAVYASQVKDQHVVLTIHIIESPRLSDYSFEGIKSRAKEKLLEKLTLVKGKVVTDELIKHTKQVIKDYWVEKGYSDTVVAITSVPDPEQAGHVQLNIKIDKGNKWIVNGVDFEGNEHIDSDVLRNQLKNTRGKARFTLVKDILKQVVTLKPIKKGGVLWHMPSLEELNNYYRKHVVLFPSKFSPTRFEEDKNRIIDYYQSKGFRDIAIIDETVCEQENGLLNTKIKLEEGKQYRIGSIRWVGNYCYKDEKLSKILDIKEGDIYNPSLIQQKLQPGYQGESIGALYANNGYLFFGAEPVEVGLEGNRIALEIRIQEGPEVRINKVLIQGNRITHDKVIRRELRTLPGDKFSFTKMQRSYRELAMLNIFDRNIGIDPIPNADNTVDIKYTVKDRPKFEVKFSGTFAGEEGFVGGLALATNNFSLGNLFTGKLPVGGGQTLGLTAQTNGKQYKNFEFQFTEPWLGGTQPRQFYVSLNRSFEGNTGSAGGSVGLGTRLSWPDDYAVLRSSIAYYRHYYKDYDLLDTGRKFDKIDGILNDLSATVSLERDSTDSPIYPKEGSKLELSTRLTPPWAWFSDTASGSGKYNWKEYHQWIVDGSYFLRLFHDLVLNARGQFGMLGNFSSRKSIGPFERFYLGGGVGPGTGALRGKESISLRGYKDESITPKDRGTGYKGGVIYDKMMLELRYPVISNYFTSVYALAFAEAGNTWAHYKYYNLFDLKKSAGVGLRLYLPFIAGATLGFDWGYGFDKAPGDKSKNKLEFHFALGAGSRR